MTNYSFYDAQPVFLDLNGKPLVGRIAIYDHDTSAYATTYLDGDGTKTASNPMRTDGSGHLEDQIFLAGDKAYRVCVQEFLGKDPSSMDEYWLDPEMWRTLYEYILASESSSEYGATIVDKVSDIAGASPELGILSCKGFYKAGDCPARSFVWTEKKVFAEDGCTSVKAENGGYWTWFPEPYVDSGCFGIMPSASATELIAGFNSLQTHTASGSVIKTVGFRSGTYFIGSNFTTNVNIELKSAAVFIPTKDVSFNCRSVSAPSGFIQKLLSSATWKFNLSVLGGNYLLSWYADGYTNIETFGTPNCIVCDRNIGTTAITFNKCRFVSVSGSKLKCSNTTGASTAFVNCSFDGLPPLDLSSVDPVFTNCEKTRTSSVCPAFKASYIANSASGTFIVDSSVEMDSDLSQADTAFETTDGALFNGMASSGTLTISSKSVRDNLIACDVEITGTETIRYDWFYEWSGRNTTVRNAFIGSKAYILDMCEKGMDATSTSITFGACYLRNGSIDTKAFTASGMLKLDKFTLNVSGDVGCSYLYAYDSGLLCSGLSVSNDSEIEHSTVTAHGTMSVASLVVRGTTIAVDKFAITGNLSAYDSSVSSNNSISVVNLIMQGCSCTASITAALADVKSSLCSVSATTMTELSSNISGKETVLNTTSAESSIVRKNVSFTGTARNDPYSSASESSLQQFAKNISLNGGVYSTDGWDTFGLCPAIPCITPTTPNYCISLTLAQGASQEITVYPTGSVNDPSYTRSFHGVRGASRAKTGQMFFLLPTYNGGKGDLSDYGDAITMVNFVRSGGVNTAVASGNPFKNTEGRVYNLDEISTASPIDAQIRFQRDDKNTGTNTVVGFVKPVLVVCTGYEVMNTSDVISYVPGFEIYGEMKFVLTEYTSGVFK